MIVYPTVVMCSTASYKNNENGISEYNSHWIPTSIHKYIARVWLKDIGGDIKKIDLEEVLAFLGADRKFINVENVRFFVYLDDYSVISLPNPCEDEFKSLNLGYSFLSVDEYIIKNIIE